MAFDPRYLSYVNQNPAATAANAELQRNLQYSGTKSLQEFKAQQEDLLKRAQAGEFKDEAGVDVTTQRYIDKANRNLELIKNAPEYQAAAAEQQKQAEALQARAEGTATAEQSPLVAAAQNAARQNLAQAVTLAKLQRTASAGGAMRAIQRAKSEQTQAGSLQEKTTRLQDMLAVRQQLGKEAFAQEGANIQTQMQAQLADYRRQSQLMGAALSGFGAFLAQGGSKAFSPTTAPATDPYQNTDTFDQFLASGRSYA